MTARSAPYIQDAEPAQRFLTDLDHRLGPTSAPVASWPATVLYWMSQSSRIFKRLRDHQRAAKARVRMGTQQGEAG